MSRVCRLPRLFLIVALLSGVATSCSTSATPTAPTFPSVALPALDAMLADKVKGDTAAPVTMIEYSSLTCSHCASFNAVTLPQIQSAYIDTRKVKLIYRDYPLDTVALSAAMVARCSGDRYFAVLDRLFQTQATWASSSDVTAAIKTAVAPVGISAGEVDACLALTDLRDGILAMKAGGHDQYGVSGTPTFIIGAQTVVGAQPFAKFDEILKALTQ